MNEHFTDQELLTFVRAMASMAASDGRVSLDEREQLESAVLDFGLSPRDPEVAGIIESELKAPSPVKDVLAGVRRPELKAAVFRMMVEMACADGAIEPAEQQRLREGAAVLGYGAAIADEFVAWAIESIRLENREKELMGKLL
jgi:uncharacterized membrane protein YebE (DUF533 family)